MLTELSVVNDCIATLGEAPLLSVEAAHPLASSAVRILDRISTREQAKGWWFNTELEVFTPDATSHFIYLGEDILSVDPTNPNQQYVQRGRRLYKVYADPGEDKWTFDAPVECWVKRFLPFSDLPPMAQNLICVGTVLDFQSGYDADQIKQRKSDRDWNVALSDLNAEETRNQDVNLLSRYSTASAMVSIGPNRQTRLSTR